jgi:peptide/nickel transport system substrate-binding protein
VKKLITSAVALAAAVALTAGCSSDDKDTGSDSTGGATTTATATDTPAGEATDTTDTTEPGGDTETTDTGGVAYAEDGTFTIVFVGDPSTLNPLNNPTNYGNWLFRFIYDPLVNRAPDGSIISGLATEWTYDGTDATFQINPDATCYDGSAVTPSVIKKSFDYMLDPENPATNIGSVLPNRNYSTEADDAAGTFTIHLEETFSQLLPALSFQFIPCGPGADDPEGITLSSGSGPFTLESAVPSSEYVLAKREGYTWGAGGATNDAEGFPAKVVIKIVADETTAANLLISGEVNAAIINGQDQQRVLDAGAEIQTYTLGGILQSYSQVEGKLTADKTIRQALAMSVDRGSVATVMTNGLRPEPGTSVAPATPKLCQDDASAASAIPAYDPAAAGALLDEAGWVLGSDGIREKDGQKLHLSVSYNTSVGPAAAAVEFMAEDWKAVGFDIEIKPLEHSDYLQTLNQTGDFDIMGIEVFSNPFPSTITGMFAGAYPPDGMNAQHIDNQEYKDAIAQAIVTPENYGCEYWNKASEALFSNVDLLPIGEWPTNWLVIGGEFEALGGRPLATALRVYAS